MAIEDIWTVRVHCRGAKAFDRIDLDVRLAILNCILIVLKNLALLVLARRLCMAWPRCLVPVSLLPCCGCLAFLLFCVAREKVRVVSWPAPLLLHSITDLLLDVRSSSLFDVALDRDTHALVDC